MRQTDEATRPVDVGRGERPRVAAVVGELVDPVGRGYEDAEGVHEYERVRLLEPDVQFIELGALGEEAEEPFVSIPHGEEVVEDRGSVVALG